MSGLMENEIAQTLDIAADKTQYDAAARKLVAQKAILAYILKSAMDEFIHIPVKQIAEELIEGTPQIAEAAVHQDTPDAQGAVGGKMSGTDRVRDMATEDVSIREGRVLYDIRFIVRIPQNGERIEIIVNVELQSGDLPGYPIPKRGIYYGSRLISAQRGTVFKNQEYEKINKVVSIWICENSAISRSDTINEYYFCENCRRGNYQEDRKNYDLIRVIVMRLGSQGEESEDDAVRLLSKVFSENITADDKKRVLSEEFNIAVTDSIEQEVERMCNLSDGLEQRCMARGFAKGQAAGRAEGRTEGAMETLFSLVKKGLLTISAAAQQAEMPMPEFEQRYRMFLKK